MFFDETFELTAGHALRANVGHCDLYILRHELGNYAHELDGMRPRHCHQRWLAKGRPRITEIAEEVFGKFIACSRRPALWIAGLARLPGDQSPLPVFPHC